MKFKANITKRTLRRKQRNGDIIEQDRYVLNYRDPKTDRRAQRFFDRQKDAQLTMQKLYADVEQGLYSSHKKPPTVVDAFELWFEDRSADIKPMTARGYECCRNYIVGPLLAGTKRERHLYTQTGKVPKGCKLLPMLGAHLVTELTPADIRAWHRTLCDQVGTYTANKSMQRLKAMLAMIAEDYNIRPPVMPARIGKGRRKEKKAILLPVQIKMVLETAKEDQENGIYYAFPFLAGTRPSEQLALHWEDVDFERNVIKIHRMLEKNGEITNFTKTEAGIREVPMCSTLRAMLLEWKLRCPRKDGELWLVFPSRGVRQAWPKKKVGGGVLLYSNFRQRIWVPAFKRLAEQHGIPYVTPHSARHAFISTLQAQGIEVGLVAKIVGHSDPSVTLGHYTQAVRDGGEVIETLAQAYCA